MHIPAWELLPAGSASVRAGGPERPGLRGGGRGGEGEGRRRKLAWANDNSSSSHLQSRFNSLQSGVHTRQLARARAPSLPCACEPPGSVAMPRLPPWRGRHLPKDTLQTCFSAQLEGGFSDLTCPCLCQSDLIDGHYPGTSPQGGHRGGGDAAVHLPGKALPSRSLQASKSSWKTPVPFSSTLPMSF